MIATKNKISPESCLNPGDGPKHPSSVQRCLVSVILDRLNLDFKRTSVRGAASGDKPHCPPSSDAASHQGLQSRIGSRARQAPLSVYGSGQTIAGLVKDGMLPILGF